LFVSLPSGAKEWVRTAKARKLMAQDKDSLISEGRGSKGEKKK